MLYFLQTTGPGSTDSVMQSVLTVLFTNNNNIGSYKCLVAYGDKYILESDDITSALVGELIILIYTLIMNMNIFLSNWSIIDK